MNTNTFTAVPRKSLVDHVEYELRTALIEGRLLPGTRLVTKELATTLGMSITPVREALVRFAAAGVLTAEPAQSFRVPKLTVAQYEELVLIRKANEGLAAEYAARHICASDISDLEKLLKAYLDAKNAHDASRAMACNREFRFAVYAGARMPTLLQVIENLWLRTGPAFNFLYPEENQVLDKHHNYDQLIAALHAGSPERARAAIEQAIDEGTDKVVMALLRNEIPAQITPT